LEVKEDRPWGRFYILDENTGSKVKRLVVKPGHRLSLQSHKHRDEHWVVVAGKARVTRDDETSEFHYGQYLFIKRGVKHRVACLGDETLEIIEVQTGESFDEDDIVRHADDYQRT